MSTFNESAVEEAALAWLEGIGWRVVEGAEITPGELLSERKITGKWCWSGGSATRSHR